MKIYKETPRNFATPRDMKDGEIAIIRVSECYPRNEGKIIQKYGDHLITLGYGMGYGWTGGGNITSFQVEILPKGTLLEI